MIYGNLIMLCHDVDSTQSLETCPALVQAFSGRPDAGRMVQMDKSKPRSLRVHLIGTAVTSLFFAVVLWLPACSDPGGGATSEAPIENVNAVDRVYTIDDLVAAGVKKSRQYDVSQLTGASDAWLAFFGPNPSARKDYELRFYPSHEAAVRDGTALAEEGVGDGMRAKKDMQTWSEGARERWFAGGVTDVSSPGSRQAPGPKYGDYVIYGNLIMLCQGADSAQSLENCSALIEAIASSSPLKK